MGDSMVKENEVGEEDEEVAYKEFTTPNFKIRVRPEAIEKITEKKKLTMDDLIWWVQTKMHPRDVVEKGAYDKECEAFLNHIFSEEMQDFKSQKKLTEG